MRGLLRGEEAEYHAHRPYLRRGTLKIHMPEGNILLLRMTGGLVEFKDDRLTILTRTRSMRTSARRQDNICLKNLPHQDRIDAHERLA